MPITKPLQILNKPYPADTNTARQRWRIGAISTFVFLFLFVFQPFGLHQFSPYRALLICLGYGGCTALAMSLNVIFSHWAVSRYNITESWTVGRQIIWNGWILVSIAFINLCYSNLIGISNFTISSLFLSLGYVVLIGFFPIVAMVFFDYTRLFRKNMRKAQHLYQQFQQHTAPSSSSILVESSNNNDRLQLSPRELLYITSADNYVKIVYRANDTTQQKLLRGTLKNLEEDISHPRIFRCHRSYIVNLMQVTDISGNARGYTLSLRNTEAQIPVSQTYIVDLNSRLTTADTQHTD